MSKILKLACTVIAGKKEREELNAGTEIALPDKKYGLKADDVERIVNLGGGTIIESDEQKSTQAAEPPSSERILELVGAIEKLDTENEDHFTESGIPEVAALKELVGGKVTAAERDAAWKAYNE